MPSPETITLRDGTEVTLRPIRPDDAPRLQELHSRLSPESSYFRFLSVRVSLPREEAEHLANVDYQTRMAFVATRDERGEEMIVGVARYGVTRPEQPDVAEAAVVVEDRYQRRGLGKVLSERLVAYAQTHGIRQFLAEISAENRPMLEFLRRAGLTFERKLEGGVWEIRIRL